MSVRNLVSTKHQRGRDAAVRQIAKLSFEPWDCLNDQSKLLPTDDTMADWGLAARIANGILRKTKQELVRMHDELESKIIDHMMADLHSSSEALKVIVCMLESAHARMLVSASAYQTKKH
jgi:hypothetical protein